MADSQWLKFHYSNYHGNDQRTHAINGVWHLRYFLENFSSWWNIIETSPGISYWESSPSALYNECNTLNINPYFVVEAVSGWSLTGEKQQMLFAAGMNFDDSSMIAGYDRGTWIRHYVVGYAPRGGWNTGTHKFDNNPVTVIDMGDYKGHEILQNNYYFSMPSFMIINADAKAIAFVHFQAYGNISAYGPMGCYVGQFDPHPTDIPYTYPGIILGSAFTTHQSNIEQMCVGLPSYEYYGGTWAQNAYVETTTTQLFRTGAFLNPAFEDGISCHHQRAQDGSSFVEHPAHIYASHTPDVGQAYPAKYLGTLRNFIKMTGRDGTLNRTDAAAYTGYLEVGRQEVNMARNRMNVAGFTFEVNIS